ncbi:hypothetical protein V8B97DRAFT_536391 [Scleroderma yunnanense]
MVFRNIIEKVSDNPQVGFSTSPILPTGIWLLVVTSAPCTCWSNNHCDFSAPVGSLAPRSIDCNFLRTYLLCRDLLRLRLSHSLAEALRRNHRPAYYSSDLRLESFHPALGPALDVFYNGSAMFITQRTKRKHDLIASFSVKISVGVFGSFDATKGKPSYLPTSSRGSIPKETIPAPILPTIPYPMPDIGAIPLHTSDIPHSRRSSINAGTSFFLHGYVPCPRKSLFVPFRTSNVSISLLDYFHRTLSLLP